MGNVKLLDVIELIGGSQPSKSLFINEPQKGYVRLVQIRDFESDDNAVYVPQDQNLRFIEKDDILLARYGASVGKVLTGKEGAYNVALMKVLPNKEKATKDFIYYILLSNQFQFFLKTISASRSAQAGFSKKDLERFSFYLPVIKEQERISAQLNYIQNLIKIKQDNIISLSNLTQSIYFKMFGDPVNNQKGFPRKKLSQVTSKGKIITYGIVQAGPHIDGGVPYIRTGDIKNGKILSKNLLRTTPEIAKKHDRSKCIEGDIIVSIRATVGQCAIIPKELDGANLTQGTARISPNVIIINPNYLFATLQSAGFQFLINKYVKGSTFKEITLEKLRNIDIPVPEDLHLQNTFSQIYQAIRDVKGKVEQSLEILQQLFQVILQNAFKPDVEIDEEPIFRDLIKKYVVQDLRGNKKRLQYLINLFEQQNFDEFKDFTETRKILFELMDEEEIIQTFGNDNKVKLQVK